jgi:hypothetical protein
MAIRLSELCVDFREGEPVVRCGSTHALAQPTVLAGATHHITFPGA